MKYDVGLTYIVASFDEQSDTFRLNKKGFTQLTAAAIRSIPFDEAWYLAEYEDVREALSNSPLQSAFQHYLEHGFMECRLPYRIPVDEAFYLDRYKDVRLFIENGMVPNAQWHFEKHGRGEGRMPYEGFSIFTDAHSRPAAVRMLEQLRPVANDVEPMPKAPEAKGSEGSAPEGTVPDVTVLDAKVPDAEAPEPKALDSKVLMGGDLVPARRSRKERPAKKVAA